MPRTFLDTLPEDLPTDLGIFPLTGVILLPGARLPLQIFEPRYLKLFLDSLGCGRLLGMVQPNHGSRSARDDIQMDLPPQTDQSAASPSDQPPLYSVGCVGRVIALEETGDGRLLVALRGIQRFHVASEIEAPGTPYRQIRPDYTGFPTDMDGADPIVQADRAALMQALTCFLKTRDIALNTDMLDKMPDATLIDAISMMAPLDPAEKQALLEAETHTHRLEVLLTLLRMAAFGGTDDSGDTPAS